MRAFNFFRVLLSLPFVLRGAQAQFDTPPTNLTTGFVRLPHGTRQVSWIYSPNGIVIYDGDIVFGTIAEFNDALVNITHSPDDSTLSRRHDIPSQGLATRAYSEPPGGRLWPGGIIYYRYSDTNVESAASTEVNFAISTWTAAVPCIRFVRLPNDNKPTNGIVTIVAHSTNFGYCAAALGYTPTPMWLEVDPSGCGDSTMLHEFGHLLGLYHEHTRPDRNNFVKFNCNNVLSPKCCGSSCCGLACAFSIDPGHYPSPEYDINSIMHYPSWAFNNGMGSTLTDLSNNVLHNPYISLSPLDISRVRQLYFCPVVSPPKCNKACSTTPGKCHPTAQTCVPPAPGIPNPRLACSCRAGFKATNPGIADGDVTKQWRLPAPEGNFRVWVAEGVECNTPCTVSTGAFSCQEVTELAAECLHT
ncbi:hypothetical protein K443DRAFT_655201 [Laccaria amethystina LaAM-08-1]|uniref:Metalloendopeptidase n=1 Tax=Laccaria amethystina LaAM-08-1 TaxID=1095629 RepID=A0A0C9WMP8_9AGAR|nr:hypothetical protein K443DRAFT_655201 [Laccaria amethystina LaAM-08-1]